MVQLIGFIRVCAIRIKLIFLILVLTQTAYGQYRLNNLPETIGSMAVADSNTIRELIRKGSNIFSRNPDSALLFYYKAAHLSLSAGLVSSTAKAWTFISSCHYNKDAIDSCLYYCQKVLRLPVPWIAASDQILLYSNLGKAYRQKSLYQKSTYYTQKAIALIKEQREPSAKMLIDAYTELGAQHGSMGETEKALAYFNQAEQLIRDTPTLTVVIANKALLYNIAKQPEKAFYYAHKAYDLGKENGNAKAQIRGASTLASLYAAQGNKSKGLYYANKTKLIADQLKEDLPEYLSTYFTLSHVYYLSQDYSKAEQTLVKALKMAHKGNVQDYSVAGGHDQLASLMARRGAYKAAYEQQKTTQQIFGRFLSEEDAHKSKELEVRYKTLEKDRDLALKQLQISSQQNALKKKNLWIAGISFAVALAGLLLLYSYSINRRKRWEQANKIRILEQQQILLQQEMEINRLKDMMRGEEQERIRIARELHDGIVSQLMALRLHFQGTLQNREDREVFSSTLQYLDEATKDLRKTAHNLMPETVLQGGLIVALDSYCQKMEAAAALPIYFQHFGTIKERNAEVELSLYRIVQELIQNALKHAAASQILVELHLEDNYLSLTVEDDGIGFQPLELTGKGMGLQNIKARLKTLQGEMELRSDPGKGTAVHLEFHLKQSL